MPVKRIRLNEGHKDSIKILDANQNQSTSRFCGRCQQDALPALEKIFFPKKVFNSDQTFRILVGNILESIQQEEACLLCKFFVKTLRLQPTTLRVHDQLDAYENNIFLVLDSQPWFKKAGITTELQSCGFCWLHIGLEVEEPLICLSLNLLAESEAGSEQRIERIYPNQREPIKAHNGNCDHQMILKWLKKCDEHHESCTSEETIMPADLMLIDVDARMLVPYTSGARLLTLSYVWGKGIEQQQYYVKSKVDGLPSQKLYLANCSIPKILPQTIEDAIQITRQLGQQYLWVDFLCIDQADEISKQDQIEAMDRVYASSWLTLVCVDGPNAMYGLPGVSRHMVRTKQVSVLIPKGRLMATYIHSQWAENGMSAWDQCAWTLQERLLSPRCLFFANTHFSMVCKEEIFHELININVEDPKKNLYLDSKYFREDGSSIYLDMDKWDFDTHGNLVSVFSGRRLTDPNDVLNACQGSLNRISLKTGCEFHFGLPKIDLLQGLLWIQHYECVLSKRSGFPTWSWLGWIGRSEYPYWLHWQNKDNRPHNFNESKLRRLRMNVVEFTQRNQQDRADIVHDD